METIEPEVAAPPSAPPSGVHPIIALCARWGLRAGRTVSGWTLESLECSETGDLCVNFLRDTGATIRLRLRAAGPKARYARVGGVDLAHDAVEPLLNREVTLLLTVLVAWVKRHGDGAELAALLAELPQSDRGPDADASTGALPTPSSPALWNGDPERAEHQVRSDAPRSGDAPAPTQPYIVVHEAPPLDPTRKCPPDRPVLGFDFIDAADVVRYPDALREIYQGTRGGFVIRGVYSPEEMARVVARLEANQQKFPQMLLPPTQKSYFLGLCLEGGDPTLKEYLAAAERFRAETLPIFEGMEPFETRLERLFRSLAGGREVGLAHFHDGRPYTPATIRILPEGAQLATHCGNEMFNRPTYRHLHTMVDDFDQISYFLTLQHPEEGGGLIIYSLKWAEVGPEHILPDGRSNVGALLAESEWMEVRTQAGDVLIFDGGRYLHRVDFIRGSRTRWTMGGFLMFNKAGDKVLYWA